MCGIIGQLNLPGKNVEQQSLENAIDLMQYRGPDDQGHYIDGNVGLGHVRLSILDLSQLGHQPMISDDEHLIIVYNGEVYNFPDLKADLVAEGYEFKSNSDTEVILKGFMAWGVDLFVKMNGMYALCIYDKQAQKAWLCRDRFGIKPLYVYSADNQLAFSSEMASLQPLCDQQKSLNWQPIKEFAYYGTTLGEHTLYKNITKLKPGTYLEVNTQTLEVKQETYWAMEDVKPRQSKDPVQDVRELLEKAVARQLVSDVPVGVFLSGGIDSSAVTAFASKHYSGTLNTYSVGFDFDKGVNELPKAKGIAEKFGTNHHEMRISGYDLVDVVQKMVDHHDHPFSDAANIPLFLLSETVKKEGRAKVVLQGDGGDELFGGYRRHSLLSKKSLSLTRLLAKIGAPLVNLVNIDSSLYRRIQRFANIYAQHDDGLMMAGLLTEESLKAPVDKLFGEAFNKDHSFQNPFAAYQQQNERFAHLDIAQRMLYTDMQVILPDIFLEKVDRSTMAASLEIRVPFLDHELTDYVLGLGSDVKLRTADKKYLLKQALIGIVPDDILFGPKVGFGVPYGFWLTGALKELFLSTLDELQASGLDMLNYRYIKRLFESHCAGNNHSFLLWKVLNLALWLRKNKALIL